MTRLLTVQEYGYLAIIGLIFTVPNLLINISIEKSILAKHFITPIVYSTYLVFNTILASVLYLIIVLCSNFFERYFNVHDLRRMLIVMGLSLLFDAIAQIFSVKLLHENNVLLRGKIFIASSIFGSISALLSLYSGFGLWSYIIMVLSISVSQFFLLLIFVRLRLQWKFKLAVLYFHLRRNSTTFVSFFFDGFLNTLFTYLLAIFSSTNLAFYSRGDSLSKTFALNISNVLEKNYVKTFKNSERIRETLNQFSTIRLNLFLLMILASSFMYCSSFYMFSLIFGENWINASFTFQYLVLASFFLPIEKLFTNLCFSRLGVKTNFNINVIKFILMLLPCFFVYYDFNFFLVLIIISRLAIVFLNNYLLRKYFNFISILDIYAVILLFLNIIMIKYLGTLAFSFLHISSNIFNIFFYLVLSGIFYLLNKYLFFKFPFINDKYKT